MTEKYARRIRQYLDDLQDERDDLFKNVTRLINIADQQVNKILKSEVVAEKETLQTFLRKMLLVFSEINNSVLKSLEACPFRESLPALVEDQTQNETDADLRDYLKENHTSGESFITPSKGPKLLNTQVLNDSYIRKPLNDTTLKVICSTILNNSQITVKNEEIAENEEASEMENESATQKKNIVTNSCLGSPKSHRAASATSGGHPLMKFNPPTEIPKQYDTRDLDQIKENMMYFSKKMGFDSEDFFNLANQFDKSNHYQSPSGILVPTDRPSSTNQEQLRPDQIHDTTNTPQNENPKHLNNGTTIQDDILPNSENAAGPSASTGAIRKQMSTQSPVDMAEDMDLSSNLKVTSWLLNGQTYLGVNATSNGNAIEKLGKIKRLDQHEDARNRARIDVPDLKFVEVKVPKVIKNNLNSQTASVSNSTSEPKTKVKDLNQERRFDEGPKTEVPTIDEECVFTHIISPSEFYIHSLNHNLQAHLSRIKSVLLRKYQVSRCIFSSKENALAKLGKFCCGQYISFSAQWFRFKVLDWKMASASDDVDVQSLDYGFKCTLPYANLRELPSKVARIPALAVKCHFPFLFPAGSTYSHKLTEWPSEVTDALYDIANISRNPTETLQQPTTFVIVFSHPHDDSLAVDLGYINDLTDATLGMQLIDMELAKEIIDDYPDYEELGEFLDDVDELEQAENLNEFIWGFDAKDEKRICRFTRNDGSCYKGKNCKLEHIMLKDGYTTDKSAIFYTAINDPEFPKKFETVVVSVTLYIDSCTYIVQVIRNPTKINDSGIVMDQSVLELMNAINHPKKINKFEHFKGYPSKGEIILAMHPIAKKWMRVLVNAVKKNFREITVEVRSVDFGDQFLVNIKNARVMQEEFMHLPFQTLQIYLDNYQHRDGCDDGQARRFFNRHIEYKTFLAHIKNTMPPFKVSLTTFKGCEIGSTLVKEGFAEKRPIALDMCEDEMKTGHLDPE